MNPKIIEIRKGILKKNDEIAADLRASFSDKKIVVVNIVSSPGSGKTELLEKVLGEMVRRGRRPGAIVGDLATDNDARRLAKSSAPVKQINTNGKCHLEAEVIRKELGDFPLESLEYLFIENVGNLVCPASYDLGEGLRIVLFAVTEGEDKPLKYPTIFNSADICVITKYDMAGAAEFREAEAIGNVEKISPGIKILKTSAKTGHGLGELVDLLESLRNINL